MEAETGEGFCVGCVLYGDFVISEIGEYLVGIRIECNVVLTGWYLVARQNGGG